MPLDPGAADPAPGVPPAAAPAPTSTNETGSVLATWAGLVVHVTARAYRAMLLTFAVAATVPLLWHWSSHLVRTGSMEPDIGVGDVVVARPFTDAEKVPVGRVMIFENPAVPERHELMVHRVVDSLGHGEWTTRGDANPTNDGTPITRADLQARGRILVPFVGKPFVWWAAGDVGLLGAWILATVAAF